MQFQVPQFIDVEDKIFGPFTVKQFVYLAGAVGVIFILNSFLPFIFAILIGGPIIALGLALAFYKVNNQPFIKIVEASLRYILGSRLYIWKKEQKKVTKKKEGVEESAELFVPKLSDSKLKDLAWSLDIKESIYSSKEQRGNT